MRPVRPPYAARQMLVCTNLRDPSTGRVSCGANGGGALRERLKAALKGAGKKGEYMVIGTSCLGFCPDQGCAVGLQPDNTWFLVDGAPEGDAELLRALMAPKS